MLKFGKNVQNVKNIQINMLKYEINKDYPGRNIPVKKTLIKNIKYCEELFKLKPDENTIYRIYRKQNVGSKLWILKAFGKYYFRTRQTTWKLYQNEEN